MSSAASSDSRSAERARLGEHYCEVRRATEELRKPLSAEDCQVQSMEEASPTKWHLAHTSWFFETFVLESDSSGYQPFHPDYRFLFNSYYNAVGQQYPRPRRGLLTRPDLDEIGRYRQHVDDRMLKLLSSGASPAQESVTLLGLHHEQQHQELILTDIKHALAGNPLRSAYRPAKLLARSAADPVAPPQWHFFEGGIREIGHAGDGFCFDNELPRHRVFSESFELADTPSTNGDYLDFMQDGGYRRPELWLSDGWAAVQSGSWTCPLYWEERDGVWKSLTLRGLRDVDHAEPVCHISYYESDAFARWSQARLPTEAEWEIAAEAEWEIAALASGERSPGNFVESQVLHPVAAPRTSGPRQLFGDVWEWTCSAYGPYPGYRPGPGALGEYNGKFMSAQMVLRGGSCATPGSHVRPTYRNFFPPGARWQFSGVRLARDCG